MAYSKKKETTMKKATGATAAGALTTSTLPTVANLKNRFKAGSIPLQTDFADLIDMANAGAQAAGQASGQSGAGQGLTLTSGLLEVKAGNGITVSTSGVSIDPKAVLPKGIITMFSGSQVPDGWLLCDGNNDTPNLIDRFIMGGTIADSGGKSTATFSGEKNQKSFSISTSGEAVSVSVSIGATTLTESQIPGHRHVGSPAFYRSYSLRYGYYQEPSISHYRIDNSVEPGFASSSTSAARNLFPAAESEQMTYYPYTDYTGGGGSHTHTATASSLSHDHTADVTPPYYILAFIMKA